MLSQCQSLVYGVVLVSKYGVESVSESGVEAVSESGVWC